MTDPTFAISPLSLALIAVLISGFGAVFWRNQGQTNSAIDKLRSSMDQDRSARGVALEQQATMNATFTATLANLGEDVRDIRNEVKTVSINHHTFREEMLSKENRELRAKNKELEEGAQRI